MAIKVILRYEAPDSTFDLNSRLVKLINKGVFYGGEVTPIVGSLSVRLSAFRALSSDGMTIIEDETNEFNTPAGQITYILLRSKFVIGGDPIVQLETMEESVYLASDKEDLVVFAKVDVPGSEASVLLSMINTTVRDTVDSIGRLNFRGVVTLQSNLPTNDGPVQNRNGDFYIVSEGNGTQPLLYTWNGNGWTDIGDFSSLQSSFDAHINDEGTKKHVTSNQKDALIGTSGSPSSTNPYVTSNDTRIGTQQQSQAMGGGGDLGTPSATNKYLTEQKSIAIRTSFPIINATATYIEIPGSAGPIFVGREQNTGTNSSAKNFFLTTNVYGEGWLEIIDVYTDNSLTSRLDPQADPNVDDDGFWTSNDSLFLKVGDSAESFSDKKVVYGKKDKIGDFLVTSSSPNYNQQETSLPRLITDPVIKPKRIIVTGSNRFPESFYSESNIHVYDKEAGYKANSDARHIVVESDDDCGISIISKNDKKLQILFGNEHSNEDARIRYTADRELKLYAKGSRQVILGYDGDKSAYFDGDIWGNIRDSGIEKLSTVIQEISGSGGILETRVTALENWQTNLDSRVRVASGSTTINEDSGTGVLVGSDGTSWLKTAAGGVRTYTNSQIKIYGDSGKGITVDGSGNATITCPDFTISGNTTTTITSSGDIDLTSNSAIKLNYSTASGSQRGFVIYNNGVIHMLQNSGNALIDVDPINGSVVLGNQNTEGGVLVRSKKHVLVQSMDVGYLQILDQTTPSVFKGVQLINLHGDNGLHIQTQKGQTTIDATVTSTGIRITNNSESHAMYISSDIGIGISASKGNVNITATEVDEVGGRINLYASTALLNNKKILAADDRQWSAHTSWLFSEGAGGSLASGASLTYIQDMSTWGPELTDMDDKDLVMCTKHKDWIGSNDPAIIISGSVWSANEIKFEIYNGSGSTYNFTAHDHVNIRLFREIPES